MLLELLPPLVNSVVSGLPQRRGKGRPAMAAPLTSAAARGKGLSPGAAWSAAAACGRPCCGRCGCDSSGCCCCCCCACGCCCCCSTCCTARSKRCTAVRSPSPGKPSAQSAACCKMARVPPGPLQPHYSPPPPGIPAPCFLIYILSSVAFDWLQEHFGCCASCKHAVGSPLSSDPSDD